MCGKSACTVWRGEGSKPIDPSYPYLTEAPFGARHACPDSRIVHANPRHLSLPSGPSPQQRNTKTHASGWYDVSACRHVSASLPARAPASVLGCEVLQPDIRPLLALIPYSRDLSQPGAGEGCGCKHRRLPLPRAAGAVAEQLPFTFTPPGGQYTRAAHPFPSLREDERWCDDESDDALRRDACCVPVDLH